MKTKSTTNCKIPQTITTVTALVPMPRYRQASSTITVVLMAHWQFFSTSQLTVFRRGAFFQATRTLLCPSPHLLTAGYSLTPEPFAGRPYSHTPVPFRTYFIIMAAPPLRQHPRGLLAHSCALQPRVFSITRGLLAHSCALQPRTLQDLLDDGEVTCGGKGRKA